MEVLLESQIRQVLMDYFRARCEWGMSESIRAKNEIWHAIG